MRKFVAAFSLLAVMAIAPQVTAQVIISEVIYDGAGTDVDTFTELFGPAGTSLNGYELVGFNGNDGMEYIAIDLSGLTIPADGYFVVGQDIAVVNVDFVTADVNFQNGPDQVALRFNGAIVDSVCYGDAGGMLTCEGTNAADVPGGSSLTRDAANTDTDDNSVDFVENVVPTPGEPAGVIQNCLDITDFTCTTVDCTSNDLVLNWINGETYANIDILLDGALLTSVAGGVATYTDLGRAPGVYTYELQATCGNGLMVFAECSLVHCLTADPGLIISEVVDGDLPGGRPKWVELTNCGTNDIDLSAYSFGNFNNGGLELGGGSSTQLQGFLGAGESFVFEYAVDTVTDPEFETVYGFPADQYAGGAFINGDDALGLFFGPASTDGMGVLTGQLLDVYGEIGVDGTGTQWETADGYAFRNPDATQSAVWDPTQWTFGGVGSLDAPTDPERTALLLSNTTPGTHVCTGIVPTCGDLTGLTCTDNCAMNNDISLSWTNGDTYTGIEIFRDGVSIATLLGTDTSFVDMGVAPGNYSYTVTASCATLVSSLSCSLTHCPPAADPNLIIAEIVDGNVGGFQSRWVELANCGSNTIDLQFYSIGNFNNGNLTMGGGSSTNLSGMLAAGETFIFEYDSAAQSRFNEIYALDPDQFAGGTFINGNDVVALFFGPASTDTMGVLTGTVHDVYGVIGVDGVGASWDYTDSWARRNANNMATDVFDDHSMDLRRCRGCGGYRRHERCRRDHAAPNHDRAGHARVHDGYGWNRHSAW